MKDAGNPLRPLPRLTWHDAEGAALFLLLPPPPHAAFFRRAWQGCARVTRQRSASGRIRGGNLFLNWDWGCEMGCAIQRSALKEPVSACARCPTNAGRQSAPGFGLKGKKGNFYCSTPAGPNGEWTDIDICRHADLFSSKGGASASLAPFKSVRTLEVGTLWFVLIYGRSQQ